MIKIEKLNNTFCIGEKIAKKLLKEIFTNYQANKIFLISDKNIYFLYKNWLQEIISKENIFCVPQGEQTKSLAHLANIYSFLLEKKAHRKSLLIAFGGGVIGDLVGFAAASFLRGVDLIQIPTSLLAQVDSSVGGKTGINHPLAKNTIGAFYQPRHVIIDTHFLKTLPEKQLLSGYAEILKHSLIQDHQFFIDLQKIRNSKDLLNNSELTQKIITRSCKIKLAIVEKDEKETNIRAILNFGHTIAHWIEVHTHYQEYLHGEAVFGGIDFSLWWSKKHLAFNNKEYQETKQHLLTFASPISLKQVHQENFSSTIAKDKKNYEQGINFIGIKKIGTAQIIPKISMQALWKDFLEYLKSPQAIISLNID